VRWNSNLAYAIGLITTDGCLSKDGRHIDLTSKDLEQIETFLKAIEIKAKITLKSSGYSSKKYYRTQFSNVKLYRFLLKIGLTPAKSKTIGSLEIPSRFFLDFLRGCFDGDGYTYSYFDPRWKSSFQLYLGFTSASKSHLEWLSSTIEGLYGIKGTIRFQTRAFRLEFAKKNSLILLRKIYYKRDVLFLKRKYSKVLLALDIIDKQAGVLER
jgi:hypothetical protein